MSVLYLQTEWAQFPCLMGSSKAVELLFLGCRTPDAQCFPQPGRQPAEILSPGL